MKVKIYYIYDINTQTPIYVGKTIATLKLRLYRHIWISKNNKVNTIISKKIRSLDYNVAIKLIEEVDSNIWKEKEIYYIQEYSKQYKLYNQTTGGDGSKGLKYDLNPNSKRVAQYSLEGNLINVFNSVKEASEKCNVKFNQISNCLCLDRVKSGGGYMWKEVVEKALDIIDPYIRNQTRHPKYSKRVGKFVDNILTEVYNSVSEAAFKNRLSYSNMKKTVKLDRKRRREVYYTLI